MTSYEVVVESRARDDLARRYRYLLRSASPAAADEWLDDMADALASLASLPSRCPLAPAARPEPDPGCRVGDR